MKFAGLFIVLFYMSWAHGISQVGPKMLGSKDEKFKLLLPFKYPTFQPLNSDEIKVSEWRPEANLDLSDSAYYFAPLGNRIKEEFLTQEEAKKYFSEALWFEVLSDDCRLSYITLSKSYIMGISLWGQKNGMVVTGPRTKWSQKNILNMLQEIQLEEGCKWN
jgi:hypothetical protein